MATTPSIATVEQDLVTYLDFEEVGSVARAKACITACNRWFVLRPQSAGSQGHSMTMSVQQVADIQKRAHAFVAARDTAASGNSRVRFLFVGQGFR